MQPALGGAAREPDTVIWEVHGAALATSSGGTGHLWEDGRGTTNASFYIAGKSLTLRVSGGAALVHRFELQNVPPAASFKPCSAATILDPQRSFYDGASLSFSLHMAVRSKRDQGGGCAIVSFERGLAEPAVAAALALPFKQARARLHVIKQQFDDLSSTPGTFLMPVVLATNAATRLGARCQPGSPGGMASFLAEMGSFESRMDGALASLLGWATKCPKGGRFGNNTQASCAEFASQVRGWVCGSAALGRMTLKGCK